MTLDTRTRMIHGTALLVGARGAKSTSLRDLARSDPDYLTWLSRHSSGIRYRTEIYQILRTMGASAA